MIALLLALVIPGGPQGIATPAESMADPALQASHSIPSGVPALQPDTLTLTLEQALERAVTEAPALSAARERAGAAQARARQARLWGNPSLQVAAENLGATRDITGYSGLDGVEGQVLLGATLPLGGDRSARIFRTGAEARAMSAAAAVTEADLRLRVLEAAAGAARDRRLAGFALEEAQGLEELASKLQRQAESGRISEGEAARAHLEAVSGWTEYARTRSQAALSAAELGRLLAADSLTVQVDIPTCSADWAPETGPLPDATLLQARTEAADGRVREARAAGIPDITPQAGLRRSAGFSALYLGIEIPIPLFNRNQGEREAAGQEARATREDARDILLGLQAEREAAFRSLAVLEEAGTRFSQDWTNALDRTMEAAEARYRLGEGTLTELLDSRRARLQALGDRERWAAERLIWRARAARYSGQQITAGSVCGATAGQNETIANLSDTEEAR